MKRIFPALLLLALWTAPACDGGRPAVWTPMITAVQRRSWQSPFSAGESLTSKHYQIFTTARSYAVRQYLPGFMEACYRNYLLLSGLSDRPAEKPMPIYMLGSRREWAALTRSVFGPTSEALNVEAGGYSHRGICVFWEMGGTNTFSVAAHEGMHQFLYHRLKDRLPMWLAEGLCTQAEGHRIEGSSVIFTAADNPARFSSLRAAIVNDRWLPLEELLLTDAAEAVRGGAERATGYYGQLWALVQFIRSDDSYRAGMKRLLADAAAGRLHMAMKVPIRALARLSVNSRAYNRTVSELLFKHYISSDMERFAGEYAAFARELAKLE
ncbi:MAG: hypothetical protein ACYTF6_06275 [Planctomycetota bacterium]|jgi:hypothetical protein